MRILFPLKINENMKFSAFLFDLDGTLLTSIAAAERVWGAWAQRQGLDPITFLPTMHGQRAIDTIRRLKLPGLDPEIEAARITKAEIEDVQGVVAIAGAAEFLAALPVDRWAIVTSASKKLAQSRLEAAGLVKPHVIVTGDDVAVGKPDPQCFLLGAKRLGFRAANCLVFEDVEAGVKAGRAAGADVIVVTAAGHDLDLPNTQTIDDYTNIVPVVSAEGLLSIKRRTG
ncbi:HAD family hydrolase [Rhizobium leguminosarum bv. viciae]|nr:haloacid dehalogenase [Rhizobium leguminosarum bv. viciae]OOO46928.1 haloacid dehalogenase [Rhizobium leguminosarum bv. viciae USDA 2370]NKK15576.1 HAD-IA family hydrolase [Rhizobium leguminosarum bv. viciae]NKK31053.1 HAD-IA family hydrolase [Rhizobium leguminosarum bv. viciae]NKK37683.1 HAD-IA family hydrolase [Rhizobium leguminosarum bv. viciae]